MTAGNDVVDLSKWNGTGSVNIGDIFSSDNDKVTVMAKNLAAGADLKLTSIENLEIVNSGTTASVALNSTNFKGLEAIKLIGDDTALDVSALTQGVKIDATAKADTITGSDKADTINGGAGNDIIVGNDGDDVLTGGNGADEFFVGTVKAAGVDQILDFSAEDKITMVTATTGNFSAQELKKFDASTFSTVTYKTLDSVLATFGAGGANVTKPGDVAIFSYDGKTYALLANGAGFKEANDALVDITGANVASLTESNFGGVTNTTPSAPIPAPTPIGKIYPDYATFVRDAAFGKIPAGEQVGITTVTGAEAGKLAVDQNYLDKIAAGGIENVTGDILVTVGTGANNLSNNFDSTEFKTKLAAGALGSGTVMNISGSKVADVIVTSFGGTINGGSGDDEITAYAAATTINGDAGNDIIDASAATGAVTINGGADNDVIKGGTGGDNISDGAGKDTITGGAGDDDITLTVGTSSADSETIIFGASKAANGKDTITNFTAGATTGSGDVLDFTAFLGKKAGTIATGSSVLGTSDLDLTSKNVGVTAKSGGTIDSSNIATSGSNKVLIKDNAKAVVLVVDSTAIGTAGAVNIYYVQDTNVATDAQTWDVQLVGTLTSNATTKADGFDNSNFA